MATLLIFALFGLGSFIWLLIDAVRDDRETNNERKRELEDWDKE
jgi:hypothetical protein